MGHTQIFALNSAGEITPVACDTAGNVVVNASLTLSGEALETTQLQVLSNVASSASSLLNIDSSLAGTLTTSDTTTHSKLDGVNSNLSGLATQATLLSIDSSLSGTLATADTATHSKLDGVNSNLSGLALQSTLASVDSTLSGTLTTSDTTTHSKLDGVNSNLSALATQATLSSVDGKLTTGADATLTDALQVAVYGRDAGGNLDALNVDTSGHLKITVQDEEKDVSDATPWNAQSIPDGTSAETASIDMTLHKHILVMGNTTNNTDPIHLKFSNDNTNFYQGDVFIYPDFTSGDFAYNLRDTAAKYIKVSKSNASGSAETITVKTSKMKF